MGIVKGVLEGIGLNAAAGLAKSFSTPPDTPVDPAAEGNKVREKAKEVATTPASDYALARQARADAE